MMNKIPVKNKGIIWREINGRAVLLNPGNGKYFGLNSVGCSFWEKVDGERTVGQIVDILYDEYDVERETLESDISDLVRDMKDQEIISFE